MNTKLACILATITLIIVDQLSAQPSGKFEQLSPSLPLEDMRNARRVDENTIEVVGEKYLFRTSDQGKTWSAIEMDSATLSHLRGAQWLNNLQAWSKPWSYQLHRGRWYASTCVMGDGRVFLLDGHADFEHNDQHFNRDLEIFDPRTNTLGLEGNRNISMGPEGEPNTRIPDGSYPRIHLLADGSIFCSTPPLTLQDGERVEYNFDKRIFPTGTYRWLPQSSTWIMVNDNSPIFSPKSTKLDQDFATFHWDETGVLLPLLPAAYDNPRIAILHNKTLHECLPLSNDTNWGFVAELDHKRIHGNMVLLPDGTVMIVGGIDDPLYTRYPYDNFEATKLNRDIYAVNDVDFWDPETNKFWKGAPLSRPMSYHSIAILLFDGRVLIGGGQIDNRFVTGDRRDFSAYTPDYLWRGPRPTFATDKTTCTFGQVLKIKLTGEWKAGDIKLDRICLIRHNAVTHAFGFDQRYVGLEVIDLSTNEKEISVRIPFNPNVIPPGPYFLFVSSKLSDELFGAPSKGVTIIVK